MGLSGDGVLAQGSRALRVCLCSSSVTSVKKLNHVQGRVMMQSATVDYNNQQSRPGQLLSAAIIFPIQR